MKWFGRKGTGAAFDECEQADTPVDAPCSYCHELILAGDDGWLIPHLGDGPIEECPVHHECWVRQLIGSVAHQQRRCTCFGGTGSDKEDGMTKREGARAAMKHMEAR